MWLSLISSGFSWLDGEVGGFPAASIVAIKGPPGAGKTTLCLGYALTAIERGHTCFLTSETPDSVLATARTMLERDLQPHLLSGSLSLLSFAPFFVNKVRSLNSVEAPLAELRELVFDRQIQHVILDTFDPMLTWIDDATAKALVRAILGELQSWGISVVCTTRSATPAAEELSRTAGGSIELLPGKIRVQHAGWCNVSDVEAPLELVQGRGCFVPSVPHREHGYAHESAATLIGHPADRVGRRQHGESPRSLIDRRELPSPPAFDSRAPHARFSRAPESTAGGDPNSETRVEPLASAVRLSGSDDEANGREEAPRADAEHVERTAVMNLHSHPRSR